MDILQYLIALLKTRKQIGIEGLGTLYKKKTPGRYDAATHSFLPPSYALEFTTELLESTVLSEYIQAKRSISADSAQYFISQFAADVQKSLAHGNYELEKLGTLQKIDGQITFTPNQDFDTGFDFFALPPVTAAITPTNEETEEELSKVIADTTQAVAEQPEIEQVQVPEFEQEIDKLGFTEAVTTSEKENIDMIDDPAKQESFEEGEQPAAEELPIEHTIQTEDLVPEVQHPSAQEEEAITPSVTNKQPTTTEVAAEITENSSDNATNETEEEDTWNFDEDNVISEEDLHSEKTFNEKEPDATIGSTKEEETDGFKLKATTKAWNFDTIESKTKQEEHIVIEDFDSEEIEEQETAVKTQMPFYQKLLLGLLIVAVALVVLYFVRPEVFESFKRDNTNPNDKIAVPIERSNLKTQKDSLSFADSIMKNAEQVGLSVEKAKDTLKVTASKTTVPTTYTYDVIIASFATDAKAQAYISRMKSKGFDAKISTMHGKRKNISIASFNHIDSAQKYVIKFRKQFNNKDIYAQPIKNK